MSVAAAEDGQDSDREPAEWSRLAGETARRSGQAGGARHRARELVVQALYQCAISGDDMSHPVAQLCETWKEGMADLDYFRKSAWGIWRRREELDGWIARFTENWAPERVSVIDRSVLRLGIYELLEEEVPLRVVINEAIELSKRYGEGSGRFVNGILDRVAAELRPREAAGRGRQSGGAGEQERGGA